MSAIVNIAARNMRTLDGKTEPEETITAADVSDSQKLARLLTRVVKALASQRRRFHPRWTVFEDVKVDATGTTKYRLVHNFDGLIRWSVVGWKATAPGAGGSEIDQHVDSDEDTLVIVSARAGTVAIRVEEAG